MGPALIGAGAGIIGGVLANQASARAAKANRDWQERMSSTAHQREVADLRAAGINPLLKGLSGAPVGSGAQAEVRDVGESAARGVGSALAVKMQKAQLNLLEKQAYQADRAGHLSDTQAASIQQEWEAGKWDVYKLDIKQRTEMLPHLLARAKAEVDQIASSARAARARAALDELERSRYENIAEFEERVGELGPAARFMLEIIRSLPRGRR